jgi:iron transport multicopper oxidase
MGDENKDDPKSGRDLISTLDDAIVRFKVTRAGKLRLDNYFQPYDYRGLNAAGKDLGSSGATLLDDNTFRGRGVSRMALTGGKNAKVYVLNADNLGGYKQGANGTDKVIQILQASNSIFGGIGSYPLEGGYI